MAHSTRPTLPPLHTLDLPRGDVLNRRVWNASTSLSQTLIRPFSDYTFPNSQPRSPIHCVPTNTIPTRPLSVSTHKHAGIDADGPFPRPQSPSRTHLVRKRRRGRLGAAPVRAERAPTSASPPCGPRSRASASASAPARSRRSYPSLPHCSRSF